MTVQSFRDQIAASDTLAKLNRLLNISFTEMAGWTQADCEMVMLDWAAQREKILTPKEKKL